MLHFMIRFLIRFQSTVFLCHIAVFYLILLCLLCNTMDEFVSRLVVVRCTFDLLPEGDVGQPPQR